MMRAHAYNSDSDPESERDENTSAGALALPPKLCSGKEVFCTTRNVTYHSSLRNERPHIFDAALSHKSRIHPDWANSVNPTLLETHIGPDDGAKAGMVQEEAHPTIAGDEETYSRQEGPQGPKKRDRAAADPGTVSGGLPDIADGTHDSAVAHDTTRRRKRRRHPIGPAQAARRHQRTQAYGPQSPQHENLGGCEP